MQVCKPVPKANELDFSGLFLEETNSGVVGIYSTEQHLPVKVHFFSKSEMRFLYQRAGYLL